MDDSTQQLRELRSELRSEFNTLTERLKQIERKQSAIAKRTERKVESVEDSVVFSALINDLIFCGVCLALSFGFSSIDWIVSNGCEALPSWGRAAVPFELCSSDRPAQPTSQVRPGTYAGTALDNEQSAIATAIIQSGRKEGMTNHDITTALMAALQESGMRNLDYGDDWWFQQNGWGDRSDSVGVFQQRDSWGTREARMNPSESATMFYQALKQVPGRSALAAGDAAQSVQKSAFPDEYAKWQPVAAAILSSVESVNVQFITPTQGTTTSCFGPRVDPFTGQLGRMHNGIDIAGPVGTPILAAAAGIVATTGDASDGYGLKVVLDHGNGLETLYAHNSKLLVRSGQRVKQGEAIALMGSTGRSTASHSHFEVIKNGVQQDPRNYITAPSIASTTNC